MSGVIVRLEKNGQVFYLEWTLAGCGPGMAMTLEEFEEYYKERFGTEGMQKLPERLARADKTGCSSAVDTREELMKYHYRDDRGHRPILFKELWERYVEGDVCRACTQARTRKEMKVGEEICVYCRMQMYPKPWPEVLGVPDEIGLDGVSLLDIRANPQHPMRSKTRELVQHMYMTRVSQFPERKAVLDVALEEARGELVQEELQEELR